MKCFVTAIHSQTFFFSQRISSKERFILPQQQIDLFWNANICHVRCVCECVRRGEQDRERRHCVSAPFVYFNSDIPSSITYLSSGEWRQPPSSSKSPKSVVHSFRAMTASVCLSFWQTRSEVNNSLLIRLVVQQERASVNAPAPVYPHLYSNQVIFIKM